MYRDIRLIGRYRQTYAHAG